MFISLIFINNNKKISPANLLVFYKKIDRALDLSYINFCVVITSEP